MGSAISGQAVLDYIKEEAEQAVKASIGGSSVFSASVLPLVSLRDGF